MTAWMALRAHEARVGRMLDDPACVGELLLVGVALARAVDLGEPPIGEGTTLQPFGERVYGLADPDRQVLAGVDLFRGAPWERIKTVVFGDRRRYRPADLDDKHLVTCGRPMINRPGLCAVRASRRHRLIDPADGTTHWVGACSVKACRWWLDEVLKANELELREHPAPLPAANTGGVLERHLPEIDWWFLWQHLDSSWSPPPEGRPHERPRLELLVGDAEPGDLAERPDLVVHEGGWR